MKESSIITNPYQDITTIVKLKGKDVKVHALCTGTVATKVNFRTKKGPGFISKLNILFDSQYTEYMPIWVWVIEHPEGIVMIDTGEIAAVNNPDYLVHESAYARFIADSISKFQIDEKEELDRKLAGVKLKTEDVKLIILTHLHLDHTDGIRFFPKTEFMVNEYEYKHPYSNLPTTYPSWFKPNTVKYKPNRVEVFDAAYPITSSGDLLYVPTPGHTNGHSSIIFKTDDFDIVFAGDISYTQEQVISGELPGAHIDFDKSKQTYQNIMAYAKQRKTVYLPSHDGNAAQRLNSRGFLV
jgi:glyoxylase-like metal-dependent hydrolase (beta-lactamase superfamily II)